MVGLTVGFEPKFVKRYVNARDTIANAAKQFIKEVKDGTFPDDDHSYL
jgi:3-methyl-2-oxobutanoate hydroxymethyltransferase